MSSCPGSVNHKITVHSTVPEQCKFSLHHSLTHSPSVTKKDGDGTGSSVGAALPEELYTCMKLSKNKLFKKYRETNLWYISWKA